MLETSRPSVLRPPYGDGCVYGLLKRHTDTPKITFVLSVSLLVVVRTGAYFLLFLFYLGLYGPSTLCFSVNYLGSFRAGVCDFGLK